MTHVLSYLITSLGWATFTAATVFWLQHLGWHHRYSRRYTTTQFAALCVMTWTLWIAVTLACALTVPA